MFVGWRDVHLMKNVRRKDQMEKVQGKERSETRTDYQSVCLSVRFISSTSLRFR